MKNKNDISYNIYEDNTILKVRYLSKSKSRSMSHSIEKIDKKICLKE